MRLKQIINEGPFGTNRGFPGRGLNLFSRQFYTYIAYYIADIDDEHIQEYLTGWFSDIFKQDNVNFNSKIFQKAVKEPSVNFINVGPKFQQRHFYFLAHFVSEIADEHAREFICDWLSDVFKRVNRDFLPFRWKKACGLSLTPEEEKQVNRQRTKRTN